MRIFTLTLIDQDRGSWTAGFWCEARAARAALDVFAGTPSDEGHRFAVIEELDEGLPPRVASREWPWRAGPGETFQTCGAPEMWRDVPNLSIG